MEIGTFIYLKGNKRRMNWLFFFNDELFYSIWFGMMMTTNLIVTYSGYVTW